MPRKRPRIEIYTVPVPDQMAATSAVCPICAKRAHPYGLVATTVIYECESCTARFKPVVRNRALEGAVSPA